MIEMSTDYLSWYDPIEDQMFACDNFGNLISVTFNLPWFYFQEH